MSSDVFDALVSGCCAVTRRARWLYQDYMASLVSTKDWQTLVEELGTSRFEPHLTADHREELHDSWMLVSPSQDGKSVDVREIRAVHPADALRPTSCPWDEARGIGGLENCEDMSQNYFPPEPHTPRLQEDQTWQEYLASLKALHPEAEAYLVRVPPSMLGHAVSAQPPLSHPSHSHSHSHSLQPPGTSPLSSSPPPSSSPAPAANAAAPPPPAAPPGAASPSSAVPPPLPPPLLKQPPSSKPDVRPRVPTRRLHWKVVPVRLADKTVWKTVDDSSVRLDVDTLEKLFEQKSGKPLKTVSATKAPPSVIDPKRAYNVEILMDRMMRPDAMLEAVLSLDEGVDVDCIEAMLKIAPSPDEVQQVQAALKYRDVTTLGKAERLFHCLGVVPQVRIRLSLWLFYKEFDEMVQRLSDTVSAVERCVDVVMNSECLKRVLAIVLVTGNYLNGGSRLGRAEGFRLATLNQLHNTKSTDGKCTLLSFVVQHCWEHAPDSCAFVDEFKDAGLEMAATDAAALQADAVRLQEHLRLLSDHLKLLRQFPERVSAEDKFPSVMSRFYTTASVQVLSVTRRLTSALLQADQCTQWYGETANSMSSDELFRTFLHFSNAFRQHLASLTKR